MTWPRRARTTAPTSARRSREACLFVLNTWPCTVLAAQTVNANVQEAVHQGRGWSLHRNVLEHAVMITSRPCIGGLVPERLQSTCSSYVTCSSQEPGRPSSCCTDAVEAERRASAQSPRTSKGWVMSPKMPSLTSSILRPGQSPGSPKLRSSGKKAQAGVTSCSPEKAVPRH